MTERDDKSVSRGISSDMSPKAISRRLEIVSELYEIAKVLQGAEFLDKVEQPTPPDEKIDHDAEND